MTAITVLFGTETGNSELLAEEITDDAKARGFQAVCHGMDEISLEDLQAVETLLIVCSTWGDGEQPDNAQDLYDTVSELEDAALSGLSFSVLALGDTSFDLFCEAFSGTISSNARARPGSPIAWIATSCTTTKQQNGRTVCLTSWAAAKSSEPTVLPFRD